MTNGPYNGISSLAPRAGKKIPSSYGIHSRATPRTNQGNPDLPYGSFPLPPTIVSTTRRTHSAHVYGRSGNPTIRPRSAGKPGAGASSCCNNNTHIDSQDKNKHYVDPRRAKRFGRGGCKPSYTPLAHAHEGSFGCHYTPAAPAPPPSSSVYYSLTGGEYALPHGVNVDCVKRRDVSTVIRTPLPLSNIRHIDPTYEEERARARVLFGGENNMMYGNHHHQNELNKNPMEYPIDMRELYKRQEQVRGAAAECAAAERVKCVDPFFYGHLTRGGQPNMDDVYHEKAHQKNQQAAAQDFFNAAHDPYATSEDVRRWELPKMEVPRGVQAHARQGGKVDDDNDGNDNDDDMGNVGDARDRTLTPDHPLYPASTSTSTSWRPLDVHRSPYSPGSPSHKTRAGVLSPLRASSVPCSPTPTRRRQDRRAPEGRQKIMQRFEETKEAPTPATELSTRPPSSELYLKSRQQQQTSPRSTASKHKYSEEELQKNLEEIVLRMRNELNGRPRSCTPRVFTISARKPKIPPQPENNPASTSNPHSARNRRTGSGNGAHEREERGAKKEDMQKCPNPSVTPTQQQQQQQQRRSARSAPPLHGRRFVKRNSSKERSQQDRGEDEVKDNALSQADEGSEEATGEERPKSDGGKFDARHFYTRFSRRLKEIEPGTVLGKMILEDPERAKRHGLKIVDKNEHVNVPWPPPPINPSTFKSKIRCPPLWSPKRQYSSLKERKRKEGARSPSRQRGSSNLASECVSLRRAFQKKKSREEEERHNVQETEETTSHVKLSFEQQLEKHMTRVMSSGDEKEGDRRSDKKPNGRHSDCLRRHIGSRLKAALGDLEEGKPIPVHLIDTQTRISKSGYTQEQLNERRATFMRQHMKMESREKYAEEFRMFDKDGNGYLDTKEVQKVMEKCGVKPKDKEEQKIYADMLAQVDDMSHHEGWSLQDFLFFLSLIEKKKYEVREEEIRRTAENIGIPMEEVAELRVIFRQLDTRGEQSIHYFQLDSLLCDKLKLRDWDHQRAIDFFGAQAGKDGRINFIQFLSLAKELDIIVRTRNLQPDWMRNR